MVLQPHPSSPTMILSTSFPALKAIMSLFVKQGIYHIARLLPEEATIVSGDLL
jgi:hypothetical protein